MITERLTVSFSLEVELDLAGDYDRGRPAKYGDEGEPEVIENLTVEAAYVERWAPSRERKRVDLFKGLDAAAKNILIANFIEAAGDDAEESLIAEAN